MTLSFYGGAKIVTGANYLLEFSDRKILVDCGLFQGSEFFDSLNYEPFAYGPASIDAVFITHSHADHMGRLPRLYRQGFRGVVYATDPCLDMTQFALADNLHLMAEEAERLGKELLYEQSDVDGLLSLTQGINYGEAIDIGELSFTLHDAGHILGSSIVEVGWSSDGQTKKLYFTGDLGNPPMPLLNPPAQIEDADYVVIESAYGNRIHEDRQARRAILLDTVMETIKRGGTLLIPSFAIERTQELLYEFNQFANHKLIPPVPIFVDSPLAIKMTKVYQRYPDYLNRQAVSVIQSGDDIFNFSGLTLTESVEASKRINEVVGPKVIIAGSGMSNGGRILHHERRYLSDDRSTILFVGYQAVGTLGRRIYDGDREVRIFGQIIPVRCQVVAIGGYSAHADQSQLVAWTKRSAEAGALKRVFIVQGEGESAEALAGVISSKLGIESVVPDLGQSYQLD